MPARRILVSPDGNEVAIRTDYAEDAWNAWGSFSAMHGGQWLTDEAVTGWVELVVPEPTV